MLGFSFLLLLMLWMMQTVFLDDMYKMVRRWETNQAVQLVEENINDADLFDILRDLEESKGISVQLTQDFVEPQDFFSDGREREQPETITQTRVFVLEDGSSISLTFHARISPVDATVSTLQVQLYILTAFLIVIAILMGIIISRRISKPIEQINKSAKVLSRGEYEVRFNGHGFSEIKELSDTLNTAAKELSKVDRLRKELMANVSHDLRTPLALIYSYAEMMHDFPEEISEEQTQVIMEETKRLSGLVNDILDISQLETGNMQLNLSTYDLTESLQNTIDRTGALVHKDGIQIVFQKEEEVYIHADERKITQVFYNLLINAIHYSGKDQVIHVRQKRIGNDIRVEVEDRGEGIAQQDILFIWDRYYKVDKEHKRAATGTGLGLSIVKNVMELHGGSYGVESKKGQGSTFWFQLQIANERPAS